MVDLLQKWVTKTAEARPESTAVVMLKESISYGELEELSNQLASLLVASGCKAGDRVGLMIPKSIDAIVAILGVLKADCIYVPIDPDSPVARIRLKLNSAEPRVVLLAGAVEAKANDILADYGGATPFYLGAVGMETYEETALALRFTRRDIENQPTTQPAYRHRESDPAYILFTSGSTGTPKGVVINHGNVIPYVNWAVEYFGMDATDRVSGHPPLHFDLSVMDIFATLAAGAQLHLVPPQFNILAAKLAQFIRDSELTQWFSVPSILNYMAKFDVVRDNDFPCLKRLLWCGEVFPTPPLIYWMKKLPHVQFTNLYGPTEATIASSYYTIPACPSSETEAIPIGRPCAGEELLILDEQLKAVPTGEIGDLYIRGVGLSPGYWRDPDKTRQVFLPDPSSEDENARIYKTGDLARFGDDGLVYFLGRADSQIKSRGYRIELGEIEAALHSLKYLRESAVVAVNSEGFEGAVICCAYVAADAEDVQITRLRADLTKALPSYMIPMKWQELSELPKNVNGKIDRKSLKQTFADKMLGLAITLGMLFEHDPSAVVGFLLPLLGMN